MAFWDMIRGFFGGSSNDGGGASEPEMIGCEEALALIQEFIDGELDDLPRAQVEKHFEVCAACYPHLKLEESFREALRRASAKDRAPEELRGKVMEMIAEAER